MPQGDLLQVLPEVWVGLGVRSGCYRLGVRALPGCVSRGEKPVLHLLKGEFEEGE